jgi:hypothetical protein
MSTHLYTVKISGPEVPSSSRLPVSLVRNISWALEKAAEGAVRLRFEGRSAAKGQTPKWLERASAFEFSFERELPPGTISLVAPTLEESLPERFTQADLFNDPLKYETPLSLVSTGLRDAIDGATGSDAFDESLLTKFLLWDRIFAKGIESISIRNGRPDAMPLVLTHDSLNTARSLEKQTPRSQRIRIAGQLDAIRYSDKAFSVLTGNGQSIRGIYTADDHAALQLHFGRQVLVIGQAHFKPNGMLRVIEAEKVQPATEVELEMFGTLPTSDTALLATSDFSKRQGAKRGVAGLLGSWPGDETDDQVERALEEVS